MTRLLIIRHAEKPTPDDAVRGVDEAGRMDSNELSVIGWQRAGALAALFGKEPLLASLGLERPRYLFAPSPTAAEPSARSMRTLQPLADALGLPISLEFAVGQESGLVRAVSALEGCVLISWQHEGIASIAALLAGDSTKSVPTAWPTDRFDIIWEFSGSPSGWAFRQLPQMLLAGDRASAIR